MYTHTHMVISINANKTRKIQLYVSKVYKILATDFQDDRITDFIL